MTSTCTRVGILGCGMVATEYAATLAADPRVRLVACADLDHTRAQDLAGRHHLTVMPASRLLDPSTVDLAVILTPPATHAALARQAITAGLQAVWIEKPFTTEPHQATALLDLARRTGVRLGVAPDTMLGPALQTAATALRHGTIGEIHSATASLFSTGPERWHPAPEPFYTEHAGPLADMGPYYLTALDYLLGPLTVRAATARTRPERTIRSGPHAGSTFTAQAPTYVAAFLETATAIPVTLTTSFDAAGTDAPHLEIHGTTGTLVLPDPNFHEGQVLHRSYGSRTWEPLPPAPVSSPMGRGTGVLDLATAVREDREAQCCPHRAARLVHLTHAILHAADPATAPVIR